VVCLYNDVASGKDGSFGTTSGIMEINDKPNHKPSIILGVIALALVFTGIGGLVAGIVGVVVARKARLKYSLGGFWVSLLGLILGAVVTGGYIFIILFLALPTFSM